LPNDRSTDYSKHAQNLVIIFGHIPASSPSIEQIEIDLLSRANEIITNLFAVADSQSWRLGILFLSLIVAEAIRQTDDKLLKRTNSGSSIIATESF